ncbi:hypothetical protein B0F90DRAFT_1728647 [Multifurca ochricompacta]|uniref:Histone-lysine N-methyltransferase, H3 lysine-4 specific n=1 Tax=Multifurca ochricompacta TaxID=376703 RepID=A0AAD4QMT8_9AGAM|nr:hypothetical protein B0F90DRAFT_1728647 [Multifurca ochricompacta]
MVLNMRSLTHHSVTLTVHPPPSSTHAPAAKSSWSDAELVEEASQVIRKELRHLLEKDIVERLISMRLRRLVADHKRSAAAVKINTVPAVADGKSSAEVPLFGAGAGLKGLSFKKANKRTREEAKPAPTLDVGAGTEVEEKAVEQTEAFAPPKKKRKKEDQSLVTGIESEGEQEELGLLPPAPATPLAPASGEERKRALVKDNEEDEPAAKKTKGVAGDEKDLVEIIEIPVPIVSAKRLQPTAEVKRRTTSKVKARPVKKADAETPIDQFVLPDDHDFAAPAVAHLHFTPADRPSSTSDPPSDPYGPGLCEDDEDLYFARLALRKPAPTPVPDPESPPPFRVHLTGSARTEGYYKISHAEKSAYVAQYATRGAAADPAEAQTQQPKPTMTSSRSNRANARRQAQGLEEINQVQRAMALSKGETAAAELSIKFNQLQTRKKHLRFARSPIHDWGLYAMERISRGEMVIEYVGEVIRAQVADKREKAYERQGIGSSYLFRIDEDLVVDATKKGNLGRLINHSCDPNCTAKIITINGEKKIVIYAKQDIELGDEITYGTESTAAIILFYRLRN